MTNREGRGDGRLRADAGVDLIPDSVPLRLAIRGLRARGSIRDQRRRQMIALARPTVEAPRRPFVFFFSKCRAPAYTT